MAMSNLGVRVLAAFVFVPALIGVMWLGGFAFHGLVLLITLGAVWEYFTVTGFKGDRPAFVFAVLVTMIFAVFVSLFPLKFLGPAVIAAMFFVMLWHLVFFGDMKTSIPRAGVMMLGVLYAGFLPTMLWHIRKLDNGTGWFLLLLGIVWLADTGAYFTGRAVGRHKMYPAVSPGKTWEGAVGGILSSIAGGFLAKALVLPNLTVWQVLLVSVPAGALGQAGDLCESLLKRSYGVKDSGRSIPGHGGVLDRFDAIFFAAPYIYCFARIVQ
jgi:phosphatidate cytidylyltransferase